MKVFHMKVYAVPWPVVKSWSLPATTFVVLMKDENPKQPGL